MTSVLPFTTSKIFEDIHVEILKLSAMAFQALSSCCPTGQPFVPSVLSALGTREPSMREDLAWSLAEF